MTMARPDLTVANTILEQLGGKKFIAMTGAKNLIGSSDSLSMRLPSTPHFVKDGINYIKITLAPSDTYTIEMGKVRGIKYTRLVTHDDVYVENLRRIISDETGLALSLGRMG